MPSLDSIARLLAGRGALPEPVIRRAQAEATSRAAFLGAVLQLGVPEPDLVALVAEQLGMPGVDLSRTTLDLDVLDAVPRVVAEADLVLPLSNEGGRLHVAVSAGAEEHEVLEELRFITGLEVSAYAALPSALQLAVAAAYDARERGERFWRGSLSPGAGASVAVLRPGHRPEELAGPRTEEIYDRTQELEELRGEDLALEIGLEEGEVVEVLDSVDVRVGPARLLAVDDDPAILHLLEKTLRAQGYAVEVARDGREAELKLQHNRYELVLLDAMLPHVNGFELCARLKGNARTRSMPVIVLSAVYRGWRYAHDARESFGADDFVEKPFHLPDLLARIAARLNGAPPPAPPSARAEQLYAEGMSRLEANDPAGASALLQAALKEDPFSARAHFALGRALHAQGDLFSAITAYERAVELRPTLFQALRALAGLYEEKGFRRRAAEALERAMQLAPDAQTREELRARLLPLL